MYSITDIIFSGVIVRILKAFALQENVPKILSGKIGRNSINCLHGIRFLSLTWVILGHTFNYGIVSTPSIWTTGNKAIMRYYWNTYRDSYAIVLQRYRIQKPV